MFPNTTVSAGALYYPYIHIKDLNWLKANLLVFPFVSRMVPYNFLPRDNEEIRPFTLQWGNNDPLLQPANLFSPRVQKAQDDLARKLKESDKDEEFLRNYGKESARRNLNKDDYGFQIHVEKLNGNLRSVLKDQKLSWDPFKREPWDDSGYIELHPRIGEAVMSTLAIACAQSSGLDIVGDARSGELHRCLLEKRLNEVYKFWLSPNEEMDSPKVATGEELLEFIVGFTGDISKISAADFHELVKEREPITKLIAELRDHASKIPAMDEGEKREEAFKTVADKVMENWKKDQRNLSNFGREFFGEDAAKLATGFAKTIAEKTFTGGVAGTATAGVAGTVAAGWFGSLAAGGIIGAGSGLVVGLIAHAGTSYYKMVKREKNSPYRFLTTLEKAGIVYRLEPNKESMPVEKEKNSIS